MNWIALSYSLSAQSSSPRVAIWRRLKRIGAIAQAGGVYILPAQDDCLEAFVWLAQQVRQAGGEALVIHIAQFEGLNDQEIINRFNLARQTDYADVEKQIVQIEDTLSRQASAETRVMLKDDLERIQKQHEEINRIDYFECPEHRALAARLARIRQSLFADAVTPVAVVIRDVETYRNTCWVTRPYPYIDRLACIWLIRRFINPDAVIRYATEAKTDEIPFDMPGAEFSHQDSLCTFEVMLLTFGLDDLPLHTLAEIVHEIDVRDGIYSHAETGGVDTLLHGWQLTGLTDDQMEARGLAVFDGLYAALAAKKHRK